MWGCEKLLRARKETSPAPSLPPNLPYWVCTKQFMISFHSFCKINGIFSLPKPEPSIPEHLNSPNHERDMGKRDQDLEESPSIKYKGSPKMPLI